MLHPKADAPLCIFLTLWKIYLQWYLSSFHTCDQALEAPLFCHFYVYWQQQILTDISSTTSVLTSSENLTHAPLTARVQHKHSCCFKKRSCSFYQMSTTWAKPQLTHRSPQQLKSASHRAEELPETQGRLRMPPLCPTVRLLEGGKAASEPPVPVRPPCTEVCTGQGQKSGFLLL